MLLLLLLLQLLLLLPLLLPLLPLLKLILPLLLTCDPVVRTGVQLCRPVYPFRDRFILQYLSCPLHISCIHYCTMLYHIDCPHMTFTIHFTHPTFH